MPDSAPFGRRSEHEWGPSRTVANGPVRDRLGIWLLRANERVADATAAPEDSPDLPLVDRVLRV